MADRCPDRDSLADFANGRMAALQRAKIDLHLAECAACRNLIAGGAGADGPTTGAAALAGQAEHPAEDVSVMEPPSRQPTPHDATPAPVPTTRRRRVLRLTLVSAAVLVVLSGLVFFVGFRKGAEHYETIARTAFQAGDYMQVEAVCQRLQSRNPERTVGHLLQANLLFFEGDLTTAAASYQQALDAKEGRRSDKAEALMGLGRIASEQGQTQAAMQWYRRAADTIPESAEPILAQAALLERQGDFRGAGDMVRQVGAAAEDQQTVTAWAARLAHRAAEAADEKHRIRIDRLVQTRRSRPPEDGPSESQREWRSRPLTVWLMDVDNVGYGLREGGAALLTGGIMDRLMAERRLQLVEPDLVDRLKVDVTPGPFNPADPASVRTLGRLAAARLIVTGRMVQSAPKTEVTLRCVETGSGQVTAVVNHMFDIHTPLSVMADRMADELILKLRNGYPLRATVLEKHGTKLFLDIGRRRGAVMGAVLKALENDLSAKVINVDSDKCVAEILSGIDVVEIGLRLEEVN